MTDTTLYAWARPADLAGGPFKGHFDHCWVTSFPETVDPVQQPDPPEGWQPPKSYWYCYGSAHTVASAALGSAPATLSVADAISPSNVKARPPGSEPGGSSTTSGSIVLYGLDGVCHNVANQVLYSTGSASSEPIRVLGSDGYPLVTFFYENYGLNIAGWNTLVKKVAPDITPPGDDFLVFMNQCVPADKHTELLGIRLAAQTSIIALRSSVTSGLLTDYDKELDVIVAGAITLVTNLLGKDILLALFPGLKPEDTSWLRPEA